MIAHRWAVVWRRVVFDALLRCTRPARLWDLYAFASGPSRFSNTDPKVRLLNEYFRLLGMGSRHASIGTIEDGSFTSSTDCWRISDVNCNYTMCPTYPFALLVPKFISDEELQQACTFRARCRLPAISWCDTRTGAVIARSSQPLVGLMMNMRSNADEKLVAALCTQLAGSSEIRRKLCIADARPRKNALANGAMGGGSESSSNYFQSEIVFFGIDNIHAMRDSLARLRDYLDTHGTTSSDGMSSFLRHGGSTWGGGNLSSMSASVSTLGDSGWLIHIQNLLAGSAWIAARVAIESASVLVHCSDGWDRTTQLVSLASLMLDPYYRTFNGFQALVEKDWLAFGHPFSDRLGIPTLSGSGNMPFEFSRQSSTGSFPSSPMRQGSGSFTSQAPNSSHAQTTNNCSPIFVQVRVSICVQNVDMFLLDFPSFTQWSLAIVEAVKIPCGANLVAVMLISDSQLFLRRCYIQIQSSGDDDAVIDFRSRIYSMLPWVDCVSQMLRMYPFAFEFSSTFLVDFLDSVLSCRFGNFLCNSEKERQQSGVSDACGCLWMYLTDLRASEGSSHVHHNLFYDPLKHEGPILPPAAALAPTLWPQFHLRWACPSEARAGEVEAQCRKMAKRFSELQKAKEVAERKAKEVSSRMETLAVELRNEKQISSSAMSLAKRASRENAATKRAIQSLGCNVHLSGIGDFTVDIKNNPTEIPQKFMYSSSEGHSDGTIPHNEESDMSVSITVMADEDASSSTITQVCESLCPYRTRDGGCRWPDSGCAQLGSQFVGLKADYEAFDHLSIDDSYFQSE
ncbi:hypothetical protein RJ639_044101 [Escallonia herrerae]|uniref:Myotubularin phosphatase domain-containing protein n=1 Tax=Escallonia herrerae TaxID=1293975 RepID=A0AA88WD57_9ASTE|nr:hypothetical protein RJ639_044101 [Escallonia herrerae]